MLACRAVLGVGMCFALLYAFCQDLVIWFTTILALTTTGVILTRAALHEQTGSRILSHGPHDLCAICLESLSAEQPSLQGSPSCQHLFHEHCLRQCKEYSDACPTCRRVPLEETAARTQAGPDTSAWSWSWLTLMLVPWPRTLNACSFREDPWDASRGIGDWRARAEALYAAEAAAEAAAEEDDESSGEEEDNEATVCADTLTDHGLLTIEKKPDSELTDAELLERHPWLLD